MSKAEKEQLVDRLSKMTQAELLHWCDARWEEWANQPSEGNREMNTVRRTRGANARDIAHSKMRRLYS